jgi:predicted permease
MRALLQDLRYGIRISLKSPGFTVAALLTLAVGIAVNATVFSWIDSVLLRPIPGTSEAHGLVVFETLTPNREPITTSYPDYRDYRDHLKLLAGLALHQPHPLHIGEEDHSQRVWGELVSGNYFAVLGVRPALGRVFAPDEYGDKQGGYPMAIISHRLWQRLYQSDTRVIGRMIRVNRQQLTVVGVAPAAFRGGVPGLQFDIWIPAMMATQLNLMPDWMLRDRQTRSFFAIARLRPGTSMEQARGEIAALAQQMAAAEPRTNRGMSATLLPVWKGHFGAQAILLAPLEILMAVCGVVLLIVCANVANLLLARTTGRQREFSVRMALGAGRARLVWQLLLEALILAVMGAVVALPLCLFLSRSLGSLVPQGDFPTAMETGMNGDILAFTAIVCLLACLVSGIVPAWSVSRADLNGVLKEGGRSGSVGRRSQRVRGLLVVSEVALALVALIGAGLFARSFQLARRIHPGLDPNHVVVSHLSLASAGYSVPERKQFCLRLRERLESEPGIVAATYADQIPLGFGGWSWEDLRIEGYVPSPNENLKIYRSVVAPGYFELVKIPLLSGRNFTEQDDLGARLVMIVTEAFARHFFAGRNPIGYKVHGWGDWFTVVGVVKDSKYRTPNEAPQPFFYVPFRQVYRADLDIAFYVRTAGDDRQGLAALRHAVGSMDPNVGVFDAMPMTEYISAALFAQKVAASLLAVLGAIALVLAAVGLYSVMAYSITQRTQEIGIRMALGAASGDVIRLVLRQGMLLTVAGLVAGVAIALAVTRLASGLLVQVSANDPLIFAGSVAFLAAVALAAAWLPARRTTRIDPNTALRCE